MKNLIIENNLLYLKERLIVLFFDRLRFRILRKHHDSSMKKHFDYKIMFHAMFNNYFWFQMKNDCRKYAIDYFTCKRSKIYNIQKQKLLIFLFISQKKWLNLSLNFVKFLFDCTRKKRTYFHILIIMNRFIKRKLYEFMMSLIIDEFMNVMQRKMFFAYKLLAIMINDRDI
jgi:hypothetical protein